jgi:hypothetical protein
MIRFLFFLALLLFTACSSQTTPSSAPTEEKIQTIQPPTGQAQPTETQELTPATLTNPTTTSLPTAVASLTPEPIAPHPTAAVEAITMEWAPEIDIDIKIHDEPIYLKDPEKNKEALYTELLQSFAFFDLNRIYNPKQWFIRSEAERAWLFMLNYRRKEFRNLLHF